MVLQYAMYDRKARENLTGDLAHIYHNGRFEREPGVEVRDAGDARVNGWYARKEAAEGPPRVWRPNWPNWAQENGGRRWYEKDDSCFIYHNQNSVWYFHAPNGNTRYFCRVSPDQVPAAPPAEGWERWRRGRAPAPTLRVVD